MRQIESFFWGIIAALGALVIELIVFVAFSSSDPQATNSFAGLFLLPQFIILGVFIEETFKYIIIANRIEIFSFTRSYIINSLFVGLGFFLTELGLIATTGKMPPTNIIFELAIIHIGTAGLIGHIIAIKNPKKIGTLIHALIFAGFFHGAYNLLILNRLFFVDYIIMGLLGLLVFINIINIIRINGELAQE